MNTLINLDTFILMIHYKQYFNVNMYVEKYIKIRVYNYIFNEYK